MAKGGIFRSYWVRFSLEVLVGEVILLALIWLLRPHVSWMLSIRISDLLFFIGAVLLMAAAFGMLNDPYTALSSYGSVPMYTVQDSAEQKRFTLLEQYLLQRSFALHLTAIGLLMILLSLTLYFLIDRAS